MVEGLEQAISEKIRWLGREKSSRGLRVGVICTEETKRLYPEGEVRSIGQRAEEDTIARHLYEVLREFDASGVEYIYSESFYTPRMGQAIMNRLLKAAGHKVVEAQ